GRMDPAWEAQIITVHLVPARAPLLIVNHQRRATQPSHIQRRRQSRRPAPYDNAIKHLRLALAMPLAIHSQISWLCCSDYHLSQPTADAHVQTHLTHSLGV